MFNYFVIFIVLGVFVCANLIVGILVKYILSAGNLSDKFRTSTNSTSKLRIIYSNGTNSAAAQDVSVRLEYNSDNVHKSAEKLNNHK